jgi:hypothetical protein
LEKIAHAYRHLLACKTKEVLAKLAPTADAFTIASTVNQVIHNGCKGKGKLCPFNEKHEEDVVTMVTTAIGSDVYRECITERATDEKPDLTCLDPRKTNVIRKTRREVAQRLYRTYITRAVWKHALGMEATILEAILLDGPSLPSMFVDCKQALALLERVTQTLGALDDPTVCRTCGVKQKKGKAPFHLTCDTCERVYFCSEFCKQDENGSVLAHANECDLLF